MYSTYTDTEIQESGLNFVSRILQNWAFLAQFANNLTIINLICNLSLMSDCKLSLRPSDPRLNTPQRIFRSFLVQCPLYLKNPLTLWLCFSKGIRAPFERLRLQKTAFNTSQNAKHAEIWLEFGWKIWRYFHSALTL